MNGHVGRHADGYGGVHGGMRYGTRNTEGERILKFGDAVGMVVCNTFFKKEYSKLITYHSADNRSMIDYLMVRKADRCLVKDVKVILSEECVTQHRMVIGRLVIPMKSQNKKIVKFVPNLRVCKLKHEDNAKLFTREMAARNCSSKWKLEMEARNGSSKWQLEMEARNGSSKWKFEMEARKGSSKWKLEMAVRNGSSKWEFEMMMLLKLMTSRRSGY